MLPSEIELDLQDPRREVPQNGQNFPTAFDAAIARHGALMPSVLLGFALGVSTARARQLITGGAFTVVNVCGHEFLRTYEVERRIEMARAGALPKGGRGVRRESVAA